MKLEGLNSAQRQAVETYQGPMVILAGAGSGKTRTLVTKIMYLMQEVKVSPFQILAVTFSNKAAREMRDRVAQEAHMDIGALQITTFHSFCARLLRIEAPYIGLSKNFSIYDTSEQKSIVKNILGKRGISQREIHPSEVMGFIEEIKNSGNYVGADEDPLRDEVDKEDLFYSFYLEYEKELSKSNAVDFGGLITGVIALLEKHPEILERYQNRFKYVLVDEYQDTNRAQFKLIQLLSQSHQNICVVGDEDQSIYSWRGADIRNILDFETIFPKAKILKLEQNYRSSKTIIEAAGHVISKNTQRKGKTMWTENDQGESIQVVECPDDRSEAQFVGDEVRQLVQEEGVDPLDIAIFYRTNSQSRLLEDALRGLKIPYRVVAGIKFYDRKEIKDMLSYLRVVVNAKDSLALSRVINTPSRGIGVQTLRKLELEAVKKEISLYELLELFEQAPDDFKHLKLSAKVKKGLSQFVSIISEARLAEDHQVSPLQIYDQLLHNSEYYSTLAAEKNYESQARLENLDELATAIGQYQESNKEPSLSGFLETITLDSSVDQTENVKEVSMMTIHGAKGLEYPYVFVTGVEETVFPSFQSLESGDDAIEEERRLFYVSMTRAMERLYLTFAQGRMLWGSLRFNGPSRFLDEIPEDYFRWVRYKKESSYQSPKESFDAHPSEEKIYHVNKREIPATYPKGERIKHKLYGFGKVVENSGSGADEKVVIMFNGGVKKKFMVKFAPIEKVDS